MTSVSLSLSLKIKKRLIYQKSAAKPDLKNGVYMNNGFQIRHQYNISLRGLMSKAVAAFDLM